MHFCIYAGIQTSEENFDHVAMWNSEYLLKASTYCTHVHNPFILQKGFQNVQNVGVKYSSPVEYFDNCNFIRIHVTGRNLLLLSNINGHLFK